MCGTKRDCILFILMIITYICIYTNFFIFIYPFFESINQKFIFLIGNIINSPKSFNFSIIVGSLFYILMMYNNFCCFFSDPGIIPRNSTKFKPVKQKVTTKFESLDNPTPKNLFTIMPKKSKKKFMLFPEINGDGEGNNNDSNFNDGTNKDSFQQSNNYWMI